MVIFQGSFHVYPLPSDPNLPFPPRILKNLPPSEPVECVVRVYIIKVSPSRLFIDPLYLFSNACIFFIQLLQYVFCKLLTYDLHRHLRQYSTQQFVIGVIYIELDGYRHLRFRHIVLSNEYIRSCIEHNLVGENGRRTSRPCLTRGNVVEYKATFEVWVVRSKELWFISF